MTKDFQQRRAVVIWLILMFASMALVIAGCGGSGPSSTSASAGAEPSKAFLKPKDKENAEIVTFGEEATTKEREEVGAIVDQSLKAREEADFATQCATLSKQGIATIPGAKSQRDCVQVLTKFAEPLSKTKEVRKDALLGPIAAMRVSGTKGYALFHGSDGKNWAIPVQQEDGVWKVASVFTTEL